MNSIKKNCGANMLSTYNSPSSKKKWANLDKCDTLVSEYIALSHVQPIGTRDIGSLTIAIQDMCTNLSGLIP